MPTLQRNQYGMPSTPWRDKMRTARFRSSTFHVDSGSRESGRRVALHEYPKRNTPYAEDMGRRAVAWSVRGYIIASTRVPDYRPARDQLIKDLEDDGPGLLVHPTLGEMLVMAMTYSVNETRERGGYCEFDMHFVEYGSPGDSVIYVATDQAVMDAAAKNDNSAAGALNTTVQQNATGGAVGPV